MGNVPKRVEVIGVLKQLVVCVDLSAMECLRRREASVYDKGQQAQRSVYLYG